MVMLVRGWATEAASTIPSLLLVTKPAWMLALLTPGCSAGRGDRLQLAAVKCTMMAQQTMTARMGDPATYQQAQAPSGKVEDATE